MEKYWIRKNSNSNEVGLISLNENQLQEVEHWIYNNENFVKPIVENDAIIEGATPEEIAELNRPIIPNEITVIPFFVQLELMGITEQNIIDKIVQLHKLGILTDAQKIEALISVKRATKFERSHPFITIIAQAFSIPENKIDEIFINGNL